MRIENQESMDFITIPEASKKYKFTHYFFYESIKKNPNFPFVNLGPYKNYRISTEHFEEYLKEKMKNITQIPTYQELLKK